MTDIKDSLRAVSILKDPFEMSQMKEFNIYCSKGSYHDRWNYWGDIEFKNGQTVGKQEFEASSLSELLKKMEVFMETLDDK